MQGLRTLEACVKDAAWVKDQRVPPGCPLVPTGFLLHGISIISFIVGVQFLFFLHQRKNEEGDGVCP